MARLLGHRDRRGDGEGPPGDHHLGGRDQSEGRGEIATRSRRFVRNEIHLSKLPASLNKLQSRVLILWIRQGLCRSPSDSSRCSSQWRAPAASGPPRRFCTSVNRPCRSTWQSSSGSWVPASSTGSAGGSHLTEAGRILEEHAQRVFATLASARETVGELEGLKRGSLLIGASTTPGIYVLPHLAARFQKRYPGITLRVRIANSATHRGTDPCQRARSRRGRGTRVSVPARSAWPRECLMS